MKYILVSAIPNKYGTNNWSMIFKQLSNGQYKVAYMFNREKNYWFEFSGETSQPNLDIETITPLTMDELFAMIL